MQDLRTTQEKIEVKQSQIPKSQQKQTNLAQQDVGQIEAGRGDFHNLVDILFVLDTTGSMGWCIKECKKTIKKIIKKFSDKQYNIKFALDLYRDHPPQQYSYVQKHYDLRNQQEIIKVLDHDCDAAGGGDYPEAVMDGLYQGLKKTSWRIGTDGTTRSKRFLFHCCDAPPHGKEYGSNSSDKTWQEKGCPCGFTKLDIQALLVENKVDYSLIKVGKSVDIMESLFKQCFSTRFKRVMPLEVKQQPFELFEGIKKKKKKRHLEMKEGQCEKKGVKKMQSYVPKPVYRSSSFASDDQKQEYERESSFRDESGSDYSQSSEELEQKEQVMEKEKNGCEKQSNGLERKRSMASLVCSEVESGLSDYQKQLEEIKKK